MNILLVENDLAIASSVKDGLASAGYAVTHVSEGKLAIQTLKNQEIDLVLLDLGLPDMDGQDVCREIRSFNNVPIIVVSARNEEIDRVLALELGADDFLNKPFGMRELIARIRAVYRRVGSNIQPSSQIQNIGSISLDRRSRKVSVGENEIHLTAKEFDLLAYLAQDPGAVFKRNEILEDVWETEWFGTSKTLDAHIASIRVKLKDPSWIESVRGVGFKLNVPMQ